MANLTHGRHSRSRLRSAIRALCAATPLALAGCAPLLPEPAAGYTIDPVTLTHDTHFVPGSSELKPGETARLQTFFTLARLSAATSIRVDAGGPFADTHRALLVEMLRRNGIATFAPGENNGPVDEAVIVARFDFVVPQACTAGGDWPDERLLPAGCANALNLASTVENPMDLFHGRPMGSAFAGPVARAAQRYLDLGGLAASGNNNSAAGAASSYSAGGGRGNGGGASASEEVPVPLTPAPSSPPPLPTLNDQGGARMQQLPPLPR